MRNSKNSKTEKNNNSGGFERRDMTGGLFENDKKDPDNSADDNKPDMTGVIRVHGEDLRIAAWMKESKAGNDYLSLSIQKFDPEYQKPNGTKKTAKKVTNKRSKYEEEDEEEQDETDDDSEDSDEDEEEADEEELTPPKKGSSKPAAKATSTKATAKRSK